MKLELPSAAVFTVLPLPSKGVAVHLLDADGDTAYVCLTEEQAEQLSLMLLTANGTITAWDEKGRL